MVDTGYEKLKEIYEGQDFDIDTKAFNSRLPIQREWHREKLRHVLKNAGVEGKTVLDAGCGSGAFDRELEKSAKLVVGVDINKYAVSYAAGKSKKSMFMPGNIEALPLKSGVFDAVVCLDALDHCIEPVRVVEEFSRVMKKGGKCVVIVQNHTLLWRLAERMWDLFGRGREYGHVHVSRFTKRNIYAVFRARGIRLVDIYSIHHVSPWIIKKRPWTYPDWVERRIRKRFAGFSIVAVFEKL